MLYVDIYDETKDFIIIEFIGYILHIIFIIHVKCAHLYIIMYSNPTSDVCLDRGSKCCFGLASKLWWFGLDVHMASVSYVSSAFIPRL